MSKRSSYGHPIQAHGTISSFPNNQGKDLQQFIEENGEVFLEKLEIQVRAILISYRNSIYKLKEDLFLRDTEGKLKKKEHKARLNKKREKELEIIKRNLMDMSRTRKDDITLNIRLDDDFPLVTRHYIRARVNVKNEDSTSYPLFNLCAFQYMGKSLQDTQHYLVRPSAKANVDVYLSDIEKHRITYLCENLVRFFSPHYLTMIGLSRLLQKSPLILNKFWLKASNISITKRPQILTAYKNAQYYCAICNKYVCNFHYEECTDDIMLLQNEEPDFEYSPFSSRYLVAKKRDDEGIFHTLYKCPRKIEGYCFRNKKTGNLEIRTEFSHEEKEFILNYCLRFGIENPCMIRLMLDNDKKCWEIKSFIDSYPNIPRNTLPDALIHSSKFEIPKEQRNKKKKTEFLQHNRKQYIPCYHPFSSCENCPCHDRGYCDLWCGCSKDCPIKFKGCKCKPGHCREEKDCPCALNARECDPEICINCRCEVNYRLVKKYGLKIPHCPNTAITYQYKPRLLLGKSEICEGMGVFAGQQFEKGDFIGEYVGEIIEGAEGEIRGIIYNNIGCSYMFDCEEDKVTFYNFF